LEAPAEEEVVLLAALPLAEVVTRALALASEPSSLCFEWPPSQCGAEVARREPLLKLLNLLRKSIFSK